MKKLLAVIFYTLILGVSPSLALAATLSLSPSTGTFNKGCSLTLDINLDTADADTDGTDAILIYDNSKFTANSINTDLTPKIYSDFPGSNIDDTTGKVTVSGLASVTSAFKGKGTLAKINFTVKDTAGTGATMVKFDFDSADTSKTTDSNVVQRGTVADVLKSVVNGNYTIGTGVCGAGATPAPTVSPRPGGGPGTVSTPSAQPPPPPVKEVPIPTLPPAGTEQFTFMVTILGSVLAILGILGLALL